VWAALTDGEPSSRTRLEEDLTRNAGLVRRVGVPGLYGRMSTGAAAGRACVVR
jgi:hypothetical protein